MNCAADSSIFPAIGMEIWHHKQSLLLKVSLITLSVLFSFSRQLEAQTTSPSQNLSYLKETFVYKNADGHNILADVYRNPGNQEEGTILWIHGGALIFGTRTMPADQLELYLGAGYSVVSIDYRLAPETKLPQIIEDLEDAFDWVRVKGPGLFGADPDRLAVIGHSAGGYMTLLTGFRVNPPPQALVSFYGYGDITGPWYSEPDSFYNTRPEISRKDAFHWVGDSVVSNVLPRTPGSNRGNFYIYCRQKGLWPEKVAGRDPVSDREWFRQYESIQNISPDYPPTLLLHGCKDTDVPCAQSLDFARKLSEHGIENQLLVKDDWGHGFDRVGLEDPDVAAAFAEILRFLENHMGKKDILTN